MTSSSSQHRRHIDCILVKIIIILAITSLQSQLSLSFHIPTATISLSTQFVRGNSVNIIFVPTPLLHHRARRCSQNKRFDIQLIQCNAETSINSANAEDPNENESDVRWNSGSYSWISPKVKAKDNNLSTNNSSKSTTAPISSTKDHYTRIKFDGCGSILLHQLPEAFVEPNAPISDTSDGQTVKDNDNSNERRRPQIPLAQKGRTGVTLWSAAYVMSYYIDAQWSKGEWNVATTKENNWTVLELGSGLGLPSSVAAKYGMDIVATDTDPDVLKLLEENLFRNKRMIDDKSMFPLMENDIADVDSQQPTEQRNQFQEIEAGRIYSQPEPSSSTQQLNVYSMEWITVANDPAPENTHPVFLDLESHAGADLILLSDVVYGATQPAWNALLILLNKFRAQRQRHCDEKSANIEIIRFDGTVTPMGDPLVLLGYTQRRRDMSPQDEGRFFAMLQAAGMEAVLIPSHLIPHGEKYMLTTLFELRWKE